MNTAKSGVASSLSSRLIFILAAISLLIVPLHGILIASQVLLLLEVLGLLILLVVFWSGLYQGGTSKVVLWFFYWTYI